MMKVKLSGIYQILHVPSGEFYIGMSRDVFSRWNSHYTQIRMGSHSSPSLQARFLASSASEWAFSIIESHSFDQFKRDRSLRGGAAVSEFRKFLLGRERAVMATYPRRLALNKDCKYFAD